jgi:hypothetical protein
MVVVVPGKVRTANKTDRLEYYEASCEAGAWYLLRLLTLDGRRRLFEDPSVNEQ